MNDDIRHAFDQAIRLRDQGNLSESMHILSQIGESNKATARVFAVLGSVQWDLNCLSDAIQSFRSAVEMSPKFEAASLGLFHVLFESGRTEEAFDEMRRFMAIADSSEYQELLASIRDAPIDP